MKRLDCNQKGKIAETHLMFASAMKGWECLEAPKASLHYDFAIHRTRKEGWQKVQVKYCGIKRAKDVQGKTDLRKNGGKLYAKGQCDFLYTYDPDVKRAWLIPWKAVKGRVEISPAKEEFNEYEVKIK